MRGKQKFEMKWKPGGIQWSHGVRTDIIQANDIIEATKIVEGMARSLGATSVEWHAKIQLR